jgi:ribosomal protein S18 acetylase RimI-like enzyme
MTPVIDPTDEALLDNPVHAALTSEHERFAEVRGGVRRYRADVAPFAGLPDEPSAKDWDDAAALVGPGGFLAVVQTSPQAPQGWAIARTFEVVQMVEDSVAGAEFTEAVQLGSADVPEMTELVAQTEPGPFMARTIELGDYLGVRRDGVLVAMAGERIRLRGWTEISAVCTLPEYRGQGLASALIAALIDRMHQRGQRAFLHVMATNHGAIRLYEQLGFRTRGTAAIVVLTPA